jgi:hypothetical protein
MNTSIRDFASEEFVMSSYTKSLAIQRFHLPALVGLVIFLFSGMVMSQEKGTPESPVRTSVTKHYVTGGRYNPRPTSETTDELAPLQSIGTRSKQDTRGGYSKIGSGSTQSESGSFDFWFYDADVVLFNDDDRDGYYHGVDLLFDIDTNFAAADIYAVMYLSLEGGPWNEYAATEDFTIFGASSADEYVVVTELMSGYPTGSYDLLIEIFDAFDGTYLGSFGPEDTSELAYLPLEDYNRDAPPVVIEQRTTVVHGGGGASDGWFIGAFLLILLGSGMRRIWLHRNDKLKRIDSPAPIWQARVESRFDRRA